MTVLLTRPRPDSERIAVELDSLGIATLIWPLSRIVRLADRVEVPEGAEALLFTSANGVRAYAELSTRRDLPAFCVGGQTANTAREVCFTDVRDADGDAGDLERLAANSAYRHFFYPRGRETAADLAAALRAQGKSVDEAVLYGSDAAGPPEPAIETALQQGQIQIVTIWSQRNALILREHLTDHPDWQISGTDLISISESAATPVHESRFRRTLVATQPNTTAMIRTISAALRQ